MKLYSGIDLHSTNSYLAIIDENGKRIFKEKLPNDITVVFPIGHLHARWGAGKKYLAASKLEWIPDWLQSAEKAILPASQAASGFGGKRLARHPEKKPHSR